MVRLIIMAEEVAGADVTHPGGTKRFSDEAQLLFAGNEL